MAETENILLQEGTHSGKVYQLESAPSIDLDFSRIQEDLSGAGISIDSEFDFGEQDDVVIPEVFRPDDGTKPNEASIEQVTEFTRRGISGVVGYVNHNDPDTLTFNGKEVFVMESVRTLFLIFEVQGEYYLSMLGARAVVNSVLELVSDILDQFGFSPRDIKITHDGFEKIVDEMVDSLKITTVSGYASPNIDKKTIHGSDYRGDTEYEREARVGNVSGQQFGTRSVGDQSTKTIQIARDGLIRSYSKITLVDYVDMVANYILEANIQMQSSLSSFQAEDSRALND